MVMFIKNGIFDGHLKIPLAILKMEKLRWLTRKYLPERFEEHIPKVSCLYPEVHDCLKKQTFPAPLLVNLFLFQYLKYETNKVAVRT